MWPFTPLTFISRSSSHAQLGRGALPPFVSEAHSFKRQGHDDAQQTALCPKHKPYIIISGRVRVDLIFCLVLIKQLLHYLISPNQVKGWEGDQYISTKSFWTVPCKFSPQMHFMDAGVRSSFWCPCKAWKVRRAGLRYFKMYSFQVSRSESHEKQFFLLVVLFRRKYKNPLKVSEVDCCDSRDLLNSSAVASLIWKTENMIRL